MGFMAHWYQTLMQNPYDTMWGAVGFAGQARFAGARFAADQHRRAAGRHPRGQLERRPHGRAGCRHVRFVAAPHICRNNTVASTAIHPMNMAMLMRSQTPTPGVGKSA